MATGDTINYVNCKTASGTSWRKTQSFSKNYTSDWIITCNAFQCSLYLKGSGLWGYQEGSIYADYLSPETGQWVNVWGVSTYKEGSSSSDRYTWNHNYNGGSSGDRHDVSIWRIRIRISGGSGTATAYVYWGGMGLIQEATYNSYYKGRPIIGVDADVAHNSLAWSYLNNPLRGTPITWGNGFKVTCLPQGIELN